MAYKTDIEIAQETKLIPINEIAASLGIPDEAVENYGRYKAKIDIGALKGLPEKAKLILVTAISPTKVGIGKTTVSIGLSMGLIHHSHPRCHPQLW
jgi:formate--tetrahydrofolate ligase